MKEPFTITEHILYRKGISFSFAGASELFDKVRKAIFMGKLDGSKKYKIVIREV